MGNFLLLSISFLDIANLSSQTFRIKSLHLDEKKVKYNVS